MPQRLRGSRATRNSVESRHGESTLVRAYGAASNSKKQPPPSRLRSAAPAFRRPHSNTRRSVQAPVFKRVFETSLMRGPGGVNAPRPAGALETSDRRSTCSTALRLGRLGGRGEGNLGVPARRLASPAASELRLRCRIPDAAVGASDGPAENCGTAATRKAPSIIWKDPELPARSHATREPRARPRIGSARGPGFG